MKIDGNHDDATNEDDDCTKEETAMNNTLKGECGINRPPLQRKQQHPIQLKRLDHYTLICKSAKQVSDYHCNILGYTLDKIQPINSGTVSDGEVDMLNYILRPPGNSNNNDMVMVVTEGLNDRTVFRKYMNAFGHGVHHLAFEVDDVDSAFAFIKESGVQTTCSHVTTDMLSGLKQFFIQPCHAGFFIELIERPASDNEGKEDEARNINNNASPRNFFTNNNMAELAQSIRNFVIDEVDDEPSLSYKNNGGINTNTDEYLGEGTNPDCKFEVTSIAAIEIRVDDISKAADFLVRVLNFRIIYHDVDKIHLRLCGSSSIGANGANILLAQARTKKEERQVTMMFNTSTVLTKNNIESLSQTNFIEKYHEYDGLNGILLSEKYLSYNVVILSSSPHFDVVRPGQENELVIDIGAKVDLVVEYLSNPSNLTKWTGHKAIHFSKQRNSWVETRMDPKGQFADYLLSVTVEEDSIVTFSWPDRDVTVVFGCTEKVPGYTIVCATLPPSTSERRLAKMKRIMSIQLDVLKANIEHNATEFISDRHYHHIHEYHLSMYGVDMPPNLPENIAEEFEFRGEVLLSGSVFDKMSTDFALTITSQPLGILCPTNLEDVSSAIRMALELNLPLAARGSLVSHSAGGQAQANNGIVIDMSNISSVEFIDNDKAIKCGPGVYWYEVIRQTLEKGLMPPVINDYQYLSVGGTMSMGGVGFMSHQYGLQAAYVDEMEVVTGRGDIVTCTSDVNTDLFDCCRGGLGQVGIIGSITLPLVAAPSHISIFKLFYKDTSAFLEDVQFYVNSGKIDMIHAFLKPSGSVQKIVGGSDVFEASSPEFQSAMKSSESRGDLVFFLELGNYIWKTSSDKCLLLMPPQTRHCIAGEVFHEVQNFQSYITKDPPVVETNNEHGSVPHPSFATFIDDDHVVQLLEYHIHSDNRGNDHVNEILIMPVKSNATINKGNDVPMCPLPHPGDSGLSFFLLFLGSVVCKTSGDSSEMIMNEIRTHHRSLYQLSIALGGKRYSYDTITNEVTGDGWAAHYGDDAWAKLRAAKRKYDPYHMLCAGIPKMWE